MYLCTYKKDYQINGRKLYNDLHIDDIQSFAEFYIENEAIVIDKVGSSASDLDFWLKLTDALSICKRYVPEHNAKRVLLKLQRYRRLQLKEIESGYYAFRERVKQLEAELEEQKKLVKTVQRDAEKAELADAFLQSDNCVTAREFNVILRQNGVANLLPTAILPNDVVEDIKTGLTDAMVQKANKEHENSMFMPVTFDDVLKSIGATVTAEDFRNIMKDQLSIGSEYNIGKMIADEFKKSTDEVVKSVVNNNNNSNVISPTINIYDAHDPKKVAEEVRHELVDIFIKLNNSIK